MWLSEITKSRTTGSETKVHRELLGLQDTCWPLSLRTGAPGTAPHLWPRALVCCSFDPSSEPGSHVKLSTAHWMSPRGQHTHTHTPTCPNSSAHTPDPAAFSAHFRTAPAWPASAKDRTSCLQLTAGPPHCPHFSASLLLQAFPCLDHPNSFSSFLCPWSQFLTFFEIP